MTTSIPWWRPLARFRARRAAERAELDALRTTVNDLVARTVRCEAGLEQHAGRLDHQAAKSTELVRTLEPVLRGHGVQLLDIGWRLAALRGVGSTTRRGEVDRLYEQTKAEWAARNVPGAAAAADAEQAPDASATAAAAAAAIDDLAVVREARG